MPRQTGGAGYALLDLNDAEHLKKAVSVLRWLGFPMRKPTPVGFGGGGYTQHGRLILDGDGGGSGANGEDERYQTGFGGGFGGGHVGFAVINASWLRVYPLVGVGGEGESFAAHPHSPRERDRIAGDFAALLLVGLGVEFRLPISRRLRPIVGFRLGFRRRIVERRLGSIELPAQKATTPYFRLMIGLGIQG